MSARAPSIAFLRRKLLAWFAANRRDLPWRRTSDPYKIWLSEIMLQQTRVAAVIPYYERFLARFPDVEALANAPVEEVLRLWSGLGYYSRARNLHRAAKEMAAQHGGKFPCQIEKALALPGIGRYTAAAILSIAYGQPLAVLDGNVARVIARLKAVRGKLREPRRWRKLQVQADEMLAASAAGRWNEAMMELGATVCTPRAPQCERCPLSVACRARQLGLTGVIPEKRSQRAVERIHMAAAVFLDAGKRTLLLARTRGEDSKIAPLFSRLPHFPSVTAGNPAGAELRRFLMKSFGKAAMKGARFERLASVRHAVTYREITVAPFLVRVGKLPRSAGTQSIALDQVLQLAVSNLTRKIARTVLG